MVIPGFVIDILIVLAVLLLFFVAFVLLRTLTFARRIEPVETVELPLIDRDAAAQHLAEAVRHRTVSHENKAEVDYSTFEALHQTLAKNYPLVHERLELQKFNRYSLLYTWKGKHPELPALVFMAHQDVVPADPAQWEHPPFDGVIADGFVWGRGTLDNKNQLIGVLEAVEYLLKQDYQPDRTIYLAFGHSEEVGGLEGAETMASWLQEQGVPVVAVLDEGGSSVQGMLPGVEVPVALVGVAEKGYLTLEMKTTAAGGHSSAPPPQTAIGILARGLARLEAYQLPSHTDYILPMMKAIGPALPFTMQMAFANLWLFGKNVRRKLSANPMTNASIRTTTAITVISGGVKEYVLPQQAKALVNFRLLPTDTIADVCLHARAVMDDDRIEFEPRGEAAWEASPVSSTDSPTFASLERTIRQVFGMVPVTPYLVMGATDARYYSRFCPNVYRFTASMMSAEDIKRVHGNNERISVENLEKMIQFFIRLIRVWGQADTH